MCVYVFPLLKKNRKWCVYACIYITQEIGMEGKKCSERGENVSWLWRIPTFLFFGLVVEKTASERERL